jgi:stage II sporulation protein D
MKRLAILVVLAAAACSTRAPSRIIVGSPRAYDPRADRVVRVALVVPSPRVSATGDFEWRDGLGRTTVTRSREGEQWRLERETRGVRVRAVRADGALTAWHDALVAHSSSGVLTVNGRRYRGDLTVAFVDTGIVVINRLPMEEYLRSVVAREMGNRPERDSSALQAQAVAARSYAYLRLAANAGRPFDLRSSVADQVYGGLDAENAGSVAAVNATRGLVLTFDGRIVDAPYSSTCGGSTVEREVANGTAGAPHLRRVSDAIPGSDRHYCDISPSWTWTRKLSLTELDVVLERYLASYSSAPPGDVGRPRAVTVREHTDGGRVAVLDVETERGVFPVRGNAIRYVVRTSGGELLPSTYFSVEPEHDRQGRLSGVTIRGRGNGHGVGMCQWGAIGRARAGHSFRAILGTYYPGTTVGPVQ